MKAEKLIEKLEITENAIGTLGQVIEGTEKKRDQINPVIYSSMIRSYSQLRGELMAEVRLYRKELGIEKG